MPAATRPWWIRLLLSLVATFGTAVVVAIALAIIDLYLTGHGLPPLGAPLLDWPSAGVHLSLADVILLAAALLAAIITWHRTAADGS